MDDLIARLQERYGDKPDYSLLTEQQRTFLLNSEIMNNLDRLQHQTVSVRNIVAEAHGPLLSVLDCHLFATYRRSPGTSERYAQQRIPKYRGALGLEKFE